jgi:O-acetyl-ADP-ribose deacetylase (regulator of RNase III)
MIVAEVRADLFASNCQALVCPVNTVGTMGNGLALAFKLKYPGLDDAYKAFCVSNGFQKKGFMVFDVSPNRKIICIATKRHWKFDSKVQWIAHGLHCLAEHYKDYGITSIGMPAIGGGKGNLEWENVYPVIKTFMEPIEIPVTVYLP